ncbi:MAG: hypothetical protein H6832_13310 [Planctomycetes bacterium]|nr:hypothetical protein [Planctomycetota bacterium]MCB9919375.1 hypothetical protein [Planctomycetota bacterium]
MKSRIAEHLAEALEELPHAARQRFARYAIEPRTLWSDASMDCQDLWALAYTRGGVLVYEVTRSTFGIARLRSSDWVDDYGSFGPDLAIALQRFLDIADA